MLDRQLQNRSHASRLWTSHDLLTVHLINMFSATSVNGCSCDSFGS